MQELLSQTQDLASRKHLLNFLPVAPLVRIFFSSFRCVGIFFGNCPTPPPSKNNGPSIFDLSLFRDECFFGNFWLFIVVVTCSDTKGPPGGGGDAPAVSKW